jgi:hypothetical protein
MRVRAKTFGFYAGRRIRAGTDFNIPGDTKPAMWMEEIPGPDVSPPAPPAPATSAPGAGGQPPLTSAQLPPAPLHILQPEPPPAPAAPEPDTMSAMTKATPVHPQVSVAPPAAPPADDEKDLLP